MILSSVQELILQKLSESSLRDRFYWTGGTLLSHYYLHHRNSFDLDFFTDKPFFHEDLGGFLELVRTSLKRHTIEESKIYDRWEFTLKTTQPPIRFEFVHYNHEKKRIAPLTHYKNILIDSLPDMAANKVMAYIDRNQPKDLLDIYALLTQKKFTVVELLNLVEQKFGTRFAEFLFWSESTKSLKRLDELRPYLLSSENRKQDDMLLDVKNFFLDKGADFLRRTID